MQEKKYCRLGIVIFHERAYPNRTPIRTSARVYSCDTANAAPQWGHWKSRRKTDRDISTGIEHAGQGTDPRSNIIRTPPNETPSNHQEFADIPIAISAQGYAQILAVVPPFHWFESARQRRLESVIFSPMRGSGRVVDNSSLCRVFAQSRQAETASTALTAPGTVASVATCVGAGFG